jgi:hypothetical protein
MIENFGNILGHFAQKCGKIDFCKMYSCVPVALRPSALNETGNSKLKSMFLPVTIPAKMLIFSAKLLPLIFSPFLLHPRVQKLNFCPVVSLSISNQN